MKQLLAILCAVLFSLHLVQAEKGDKESGKTSGVIVEISGPKYFIESEDGRHEYMAHWRSGGLDRDMVQELKKYKVGDKVQVDWTYEERRRFEKIKMVKEKAGKSSDDESEVRALRKKIDQLEKENARLRESKR